MELIDPQGKPVISEKAQDLIDNADPALVHAAFTFQYEKTKIWSEQLSLHIAVRPWWCPAFFFQWAIRLVLRQSAQKKVNPEAITRRRAFKMFNGGRS